MKTFLFLFSTFSISAMEVSKEVKIVVHQNLPRKEAFRIRRTNSLPLNLGDVIHEVHSPAHNISLATSNDVDLVTTISLPTTNQPEERKGCCTSSRTVIIGAIITASGVTCAAVLTAIVTLVVHFTT